MAKLYFNYAAMGSGKTLRLLATAYNFEERNIHFLALKPSIDTRDGDGVIKSRIGLERECFMVDEKINIFALINDYISETNNEFGKLEWILIDECQFLTEKQVEELAMVVDELDIDIICYGLRTDFRSRLFPASKRLFELADEFEEVKSRCDCGRKTSINARFDSNGKIILDGDQILVGGDDVYRAICRKCFFEKIKENKNVMDT